MRFADIVPRDWWPNWPRLKTNAGNGGLTVQCDAATTMKLPALQESVLSLAVREAVTNVGAPRAGPHLPHAGEQQNGVVPARDSR